jgi:hypothetical protein
VVRGRGCLGDIQHQASQLVRYFYVMAGYHG